MVYLQWSNSELWWAMAVMTLTAGTVFLMWLGEQIAATGSGNGVSMYSWRGFSRHAPRD